MVGGVVERCTCPQQHQVMLQVPETVCAQKRGPRLWRLLTGVERHSLITRVAPFSLTPTNACQRVASHLPVAHNPYIGALHPSPLSTRHQPRQINCVHRQVLLDTQPAAGASHTACHDDAHDGYGECSCSSGRLAGAQTPVAAARTGDELALAERCTHRLVASTLLPALPAPRHHSNPKSSC
jgi:hypothetical protein